MQHDIVLKKLNFDPLTPRVRGMGVGGGGLRANIKFATMLLNLVIPLNLIHVCNMTMF